MKKKDKNLQKQIRHYYKAIKSTLFCKRHIKNRVVNDLKNEIESYIENNPNSTFENIIDHFGTAENIAEGFAAEMGINYQQNITRKRILITILIFCLVLISTFIVAFCCVLIRNSNIEAGYYYDETITDNGVALEV